MLYVVTYDIACDRRRMRVAEVARNYGLRVQRSVFECRLSYKELNALVREMRRELADEDSVRIYPCCRSCAAGLIVLGTAAPAGTDPEAPYYIV